MRTYLVVLSILVAFAAVSYGQAFIENKDMFKCYQHMECGANEVYRCCGMCFEQTCANMSRDRKCDAKCYKGCYCATGFIRKKEGKPCVPETDCRSSG